MRASLAVRRRCRLALLGAAAVWACAGALTAAHAQAADFSNPGLIVIPSGGNGDATPYPSRISVEGLGPKIGDLNAKISGLTHSFPPDVDILLVGPQGQSTVLMSDVPGDDSTNDPPDGNTFCNDDIAGGDLTFDDAAPSGVPPLKALVSGTYQPTNLAQGPLCGLAEDTWDAPAPQPPYGATLSVFNGTDPNGIWSLYVNDDSPFSDSGTIDRGWSLSLNVKPANAIALGKLKRNKKAGTAKVPVTVPGPGTLTLRGPGLKAQRAGGGATASEVVASAGQVNLLVKAKGKKKRALNKRDKVKVAFDVTFTPIGGDPNVEPDRAKLIKH